VGFNVFEQVENEHKYLVASGLVGVFKKLYADSWGPRLEYILRNTLLALLDYPDATLLGVLRMLADKKYRNKVVDNIEDPVVKSFWLDEFANYNEKFRSEAVAPIQNKVGQYLSSAIIRNIVGQVKSTFDLREIMDNNKILILSMSKGKIGEDNAALLGSMMITKIQLAAMSRASLTEEQRKDFYLYVDEFQNFATESFANILSEARKYRLNLTMAHQYIEQMSDEVKAAVFGNVGTLITFQIGAIDAEELEKEFDPTFLQSDLVNLPAYNVYLKMTIDGMTSPGFSAITLPLLEKYRTNNQEKVIKVSRERYSNPRTAVEDKIKRWSGLAFQEMAFGDSRRFESADERMAHKIARREAEARGEKLPPEEREMFNAVCSTCNRIIKVPFEPDHVRPVYCKDCLSEAQRKKDKLPRREPHVHRHTFDRPRHARRASGRRSRSTRQDDRRNSNSKRSSARSLSQQGSLVTRPIGKTVSLREALKPIKQAIEKKQKNPSGKGQSGRAKQKSHSGKLEEGQSVSL